MKEQHTYKSLRYWLNTGLMRLTCRSFALGVFPNVNFFPLNLRQFLLVHCASLSTNYAVKYHFSKFNSNLLIKYVSLLSQSSNKIKKKYELQKTVNFQNN